jgi:hypothetical protein
MLVLFLRISVWVEWRNLDGFRIVGKKLCAELSPGRKLEYRVKDGD